jgi:hypothetical protein
MNQVRAERESQRIRLKIAAIAHGDDPDSLPVT